jgi:hypothetical protein
MSTVTRESIWRTELKMPSGWHRFIASALSVVAILGLIGVALDGSLWYLSVPAFCLASLWVGYVAKYLGSRLARAILIVLLVAWLVGCTSCALDDEAALAVGLILVGTFIAYVNALRFSRSEKRTRGLELLPLVGFFIGFVGVFSYWLTSPEIARMISLSTAKPSTLELIPSGSIAALSFGSAGILAGYIVKALRLVRPWPVD